MFLVCICLRAWPRHVDVHAHWGFPRVSKTAQPFSGKLFGSSTLQLLSSFVAPPLLLRLELTLFTDTHTTRCPRLLPTDSVMSLKKIIEIWKKKKKEPNGARLLNVLSVSGMKLSGFLSGFKKRSGGFLGCLSEGFPRSPVTSPGTEWRRLPPVADKVLREGGGKPTDLRPPCPATAVKTTPWTLV